MRHIFCILLVALVIGCQSRRTSSVQSGPTLEISDETLTEGTSDTIRFGRLHSGETGIKRFRLQNTSSRTWVVTRYEVSCECVTPEFDRRPLKPGEVRQIAGRAGRFGIYDKGFAAAGPDCEHDLGKTLETVPVNVKAAALGFSDLVLKVDRPIIDVLKVWNQMPVKKPYYRMDITRYITIINYILNTLHLEFSKEDLLLSLIHI